MAGMDSKPGGFECVKIPGRHEPASGVAAMSHSGPDASIDLSRMLGLRLKEAQLPPERQEVFGGRRRLAILATPIRNGPLT